MHVGGCCAALVSIHLEFHCVLVLVLKMLAVMESQQTPGSSKSSSTSTAITPEGKAQQQEFLATGRTGRRNALPDILSDHAIVTSSDLPGKLQKLTTKEPPDRNDQPGPSSTCV